MFKPEKNGNYVNDHAIVVGADGKYHLYGITSFDGDLVMRAALCMEQYLLQGLSGNKL